MGVADQISFFRLPLLHPSCMYVSFVPRNVAESKPVLSSVGLLAARRGLVQGWKQGKRDGGGRRQRRDDCEQRSPPPTSVPFSSQAMGGALRPMGIRLTNAPTPTSTTRPTGMA